MKHGHRGNQQVFLMPCKINFKFTTGLCDAKTGHRNMSDLFGEKYAWLKALGRGERTLYVHQKLPFQTVWSWESGQNKASDGKEGVRGNEGGGVTHVRDI